MPNKWKATKVIKEEKFYRFILYDNEGNKVYCWSTKRKEEIELEIEKSLARLNQKINEKFDFTYSH